MKSVVVTILLALLAIPVTGQRVDRAVAFTIDDLPTASVLGEEIDRAQRTTAALLAALTRQKIPAIGFVNERKLGRDGVAEPERVALLQRWLDAGLDLGNHSYGHIDFHRVSVDAFKEEIVKGEPVTRGLLTAAGRRLAFFRHPFLHTGTSPEARRSLDAFLQERGYTVAPVTIDNYDYIFAAAYDRTVQRDDRAEASKIEAAYLDYMESIVAYYEQQSIAIVGREIPQTLLLHAHALNGATLDRFADRLRQRGYRFITLAEALKDPAYSSRDEYYGPAGISWFHRWALTAGKRGIFAGEPVVPDWIQKASEVARLAPS